MFDGMLGCSKDAHWQNECPVGAPAPAPAPGTSAPGTSAPLDQSSADWIFHRRENLVALFDCPGDEPLGDRVEVDDVGGRERGGGY